MKEEQLGKYQGHQGGSELSGIRARVGGAALSWMEVLAGATVPLLSPPLQSWEEQTEVLAGTIVPLLSPPHM